MTIAIETGYTLPLALHARVMHEGVSLPYAVDAIDSTPADSSVFALNNVTNGLTSDRYKPNATTWSLVLDLADGAQSVSCVCIGSPDVLASGQTITLEYLDGTYQELAEVTPTNSSPIMFLFEPQSLATLRISGTGTAKPTIYNIMVGNALTMQRPFYSGFAPSEGNRMTEVIGNLSRTGELLGRSVKRTTLMADYQWRTLSYDWVVANLYGAAGLIQSVEAKQAYVAWRPGLSGDVDYCMRVTTSAPSSEGTKDQWQFAMNAEVHAYE